MVLTLAVYKTES